MSFFPQPARSKAAGFVAAATAFALFVSGCTIDTGDSENESAAATSTSEAPKELLAPAVSVSDQATDVDPSEPIVVKSLDEGLAEVTMTNEEGRVVEAELSADKKSWTTTEVLGYSRHYTVEAKDLNGETTTVSFATAVPATTAFGAISPIPNATVGVAQTIALRFPVVIQDRQAVQDAIHITTEPAVEGAFYWISPYEVRWRPAEFWAPGTTVNVEAKLYGKNFGGGVYGQEDNATNFTIGNRMEAVADDTTKQMTIYSNGEAIKTMPISMGMPNFATPNGIYTIGDQYNDLVMDSTTYGLALDAGGYRTKVQYATQMSYSGIYVHAAPWSVWAQGSTNQSHGCLNVSTENARWFMENFKRGDFVTVKNTTGGVLSGYDGLGDWNIDWATWKAGNVNG